MYIDRAVLCRFCELGTFFCFFCVLLGCSFLQTVKVFLLFCVHLLHTFTDSLFGATVYVEFASVFYWAGVVKSVKFQFNLWMWNNALFFDEVIY